MNAKATTIAPRGREKVAQAEGLSLRRTTGAASLGHASQSTSKPDEADRGDELPRGWVRLTMGELGRWFGGGTPSKANPCFWTGGKIPWVSPKDMKSDLITDTKDHITEDAVAQSATNLVEAGSVLIVVRSGILQHTLPVAVASRQVALNQDLKAVKPLENIRSDYLALALKAFERDILHTCTKTGTTVQSLELPVFLRFQIPVAPLPEQRQIVAEIEKQFTRLEAGLAALRRVQANLKRYRATVLKAACEGQLVPTEVELHRQHKTKSAQLETGAELLTRILAERRKKWAGRGKYKELSAPDTSKRPAVPDGWTWATVEQLAAPEPNSITDGPFGSNLKTEHYMDSGPRVLRLQNIGDGVYVDEEAHITQAHFERLQKHRIFAGDVVIAGFGENPPRCCIIPESLGPAIVKADCIRFKPHSSVLPKYMNAALNSDPVRKRTKGMVHGVGRPRLNLGEIKSIVLPLPPLAEQTRIVAEVERRLSVVEELESVVSANLQRATRLRQSILQKAFTGKLSQ